MFIEAGDCEIREQTPAPWEDVGGEIYQYFNNPIKFIQPHIGLFQAERRHFQRYKEKMLDYQQLNLRWIAAEDCYCSWQNKYENDEAIKAQQKITNAPEN